MEAWLHRATWWAVGCKEFALVAGGPAAGRVSGGVEGQCMPYKEVWDF